MSAVTDMKVLFGDGRYSNFNGDITKWDVSEVTSMHEMFYGVGAFNQDISNWDVSKVTDMLSMFQDVAAFNQDISNWDVF